MTRKDFEAFAAAIRKLPAHERRSHMETLIPTLAASNRRFDRARFEAACNLPDEPACKSGQLQAEYG